MLRHLSRCALLLVAASCSYAGESSNLLGSALVRGAASVNGQPLLSYAASLGDKDRLETGPRAGATLTVAAGDTIVLNENSGVSLSRSGGGTVALFESGSMTVSTRREGLRELKVNEISVTIHAREGNQSRYEVARLGNTTYVRPTKGSLSLSGPGQPETSVPEGMVGVIENARVGQSDSLRAALEAPQVPPAGPGATQAVRAGKLSAVMPADYIVRGPAQNMGKPGDEVLLNDLLKTGSKGRMRFAMEDGSIVTVGANSQFQVKEQNTQSQQSGVEMLYGRMRAQVSKRTVAGGKFEVRTSTAVCGVIGTDFYIEATPKGTRVIVFDGIVRVTPLVLGAAAGFTLTAGQTGTMLSNGASSPVSATSSQLQLAKSATQLSGAGSQTAAVGGVVTSGAKISVIAATAAPVAVAGVAISSPLLTPEISPTKP